MPETELTLPLAEPWEEEEEEEFVSLPMMAARELIVAKDPSPTMEDIFCDRRQKGHQTSTTSQETTKKGNWK